MSDPPAARLLDLARDGERPVCLDTSAMLSLLLDEPAAPAVAALFGDPRITLLISTITLAEVGVRPAREQRDGAAMAVERVLSLPGLRVRTLDEVVAIETAVVRAQTRLRLPDAIVIATARVHDAVALIGNDRQWQTRALGVPLIMLGDLTA